MNEEDRPLNAVEEEIFHALCDIPESDKESTFAPPLMIVDENVSTNVVKAKTTAEVGEVVVPVHKLQKGAPDQIERPVRRSKRVAEAAIAAQIQTRTRSRRGCSRNSLS